MTVTIMIDGSVKRNRKFGLKLQSSHVIEKRFNQSSRQEVDYCISSSSIASTSQSDSIVRQTNKHSFPRLL